jgi:hypothetical protein
MPTTASSAKNLFSAMSQLRSQGYDVPKIAPWYDSSGYGVATNTKIDLATAAGRSTFINQYTTFFSDYYAANTDTAADSYLHQVGGQPVLNTWQNRDRVVNHSGMTRADLENSLKASFASAHPAFNNGVRMTSLVYVDPNIGFLDEMVPQYQDNGQAVYFYPGNTNQFDGGNQPYFNNYKTASIKPGFWVRTPTPPADSRPATAARTTRRRGTPRSPTRPSNMSRSRAGTSTRKAPASSGPIRRPSATPT